MINRAISTIGAVILAVAISVVYTELTRPKIGVIDLVEVYDRLTITQDYNTKYASMGQLHKMQLDSMEMHVREKQMLAQTEQSEASAQAFQVARDRFLQAKQQRESNQEKALTTYYEQIVGRVDEYFVDFKQRCGYDLLIKTRQEEMGVSSNPEFDATQDFIVYANQRYEGY